MDLGLVIVPIWWAPVQARYRRLTVGQRAVLELVVAKMWRSNDGGGTLASEVEVTAPWLVARSGWSLNHVQRCLTALTGPPGDVVELNPVIRGHGILREVSRRRGGDGGGASRRLALLPWERWWWRPGTLDGARAAVALVASEDGTPPLAEEMARILIRHVRWGGLATGKEPPEDPAHWLFMRWTHRMGQLVARGWGEAELRAILGYVENTADPHWRDRLRGPHAASRLLNDFEGLLLRTRRACG